MWNTFEKCKNKLKNNYDFPIFSQGLDSETLKSTAFEMFEKYKSQSVSKAKSEMIAFILNNAELELNEENIFAYRICHNDIMHEFTSKLGYSEETDSYRAWMDFGHVAPDWQYILNKGIKGIISDLEDLKNNASSDNSYYDERISVYRSISNCFMRFSLVAEKKNTEKSIFISENLRHLASNPPETLAQALELILIFYHIQRDLDTVNIRSLGGLDRMLYPFYKKDIESGKFTKDELKEILKYFFWNISCLKVAANLPFYICGMDEKDDDAANEMTVFILETYREMNIYDPKMHVLYHENINKKVLRLILEMIREGKSSFVFINTKLASNALENIGISHDDAKKVIVYGCYETAAEGTEIPCTCAGMVNLVKSIEITMNEEGFNSFDEFYEKVIFNLESYTALCMNALASFEPEFKNICPSLIMSPTYKNSRETGIDLYSGGAKYNNTSVVGAGLATLVDSLIAVKKVVFEEKIKTFNEFKSILQSNWQEDEKLRLIIKKKYPKFGNNKNEADDIAVDIYNRFSKLINGRKNGRGGVFRCGMFSVDWRFWMGENTSATPDGRYSKEPLSKNIAASIGQDKNGVTAYINSVVKFDGTKCPDGYVADVVLHCSAVKGDEGMKVFESLLTAFMKKGGFSVHFNILSPEILLNAQREPEKYQNLQIRLCGWNVRFVDLDKKEQDEFIKQSVNFM